MGGVQVGVAEWALTGGRPPGQLSRGTKRSSKQATIKRGPERKEEAQQGLSDSWLWRCGCKRCVLPGHVLLKADSPRKKQGQNSGAPQKMGLLGG